MSPIPPINKHLIYTASNSSSANIGELSSAPVVVINGEIYKLTVPFRKGQELIVDASGGEVGVMYTDKDLADAIAKYGPDAKNGVIFATGKTTVTVAPVPPVKTGIVIPRFERGDKDLLDHLQNFLVHTGDTRKENVTGTVIAQYTVDGNKHIIDKKIISGDKRIGIFTSFGINTYTGVVNKPAGDYKLEINFNVGLTDAEKELMTKDSAFRKMVMVPGATLPIRATVYAVN